MAGEFAERRSASKRADNSTPSRPAGATAGRSAAARQPADYPIEIGFLAGYGVAPGTLLAAAAAARAHGVTADRALLAGGHLDARRFYHCLAHHIGVEFSLDEIVFDDDQLFPNALRSGLTRQAGRGRPPWVSAPEGARLGELLRRARHEPGLRSHLVITTPQHLAEAVCAASAAHMARDASFALMRLDPVLCAASKSNRSRALAFLAVLLAMFVVCGSTAFALLLSGLMFGAVVLRLFVSAASCGIAPATDPPRIDERRLPIYTVLVPLRRESEVLAKLIAALDAIAYPRAKLDIKFLVEHDDAETLAALRRLHLPPIYETVVVPPGEPRTKPRALNIGLSLARGEFVAVFDAEDVPHPGQVRLGAERFLRAAPDVACLQARLVIDNLADNWLTRGIRAQTPQAIRACCA